MTDEKKSVLLIDDDKFLVDMYSLKFTQGGFAVQACLSVADALETLRGGLSPAAIVFDIVMPERDGFSFLAAVKEENLAKDAILIALTNQGNDEEKKKATDLGADQYIVKASMIPSEVVTLVTEAMKKHSA